jgi:hypothetical protein
VLKVGAGQMILQHLHHTKWFVILCFTSEETKALFIFKDFDFSNNSLILQPKQRRRRERYIDFDSFEKVKSH